jgi:protein SCO1
MRTALAVIFVVLASLMLAQPRGADPEEALPKIAPAPEFALISQDRVPVKLADYRGKVVAVTFIFTLCAVPALCSRP